VTNPAVFYINKKKTRTRFFKIDIDNKTAVCLMGSRSDSPSLWNKFSRKPKKVRFQQTPTARYDFTESQSYSSYSSDEDFSPKHDRKQEELFSRFGSGLLEEEKRFDEQEPIQTKQPIIRQTGVTFTQLLVVLVILILIALIVCALCIRTENKQVLEPSASTHQPTASKPSLSSVISLTDEPYVQQDLIREVDSSQQDLELLAALGEAEAQQVLQRK
jgi:hypothetical protein